jgi:uncharacterized protein YdaU (DUF1376 family)
VVTLDERLRHENFDGLRWITSSASRISLAGRGLYREMLTAAWLRGARLPNDHDAIRVIVNVTVKEWRAAWPLVERYWRHDGDYLVNDTQVEIYAQTVGRLQRRSKAGKDAADARWKNADALPPYTNSAMPSHSDGNAVAIPGKEGKEVSKEEYTHTHPALPRRLSLDELEVPSFTTAMAIAHSVIETSAPPDHTSEFKARCVEQGFNYAAEGGDGRPLYARALEAAEAARNARGRY